eukprot:4416312-Amphidinium_carterae.1
MLQQGVSSALATADCLIIRNCSCIHLRDRAVIEVVPEEGRCDDFVTWECSAASHSFRKVVHHFPLSLERAYAT